MLVLQQQNQIKMKNSHYKVVFQPKNPALFENKRRFAIGTGSIAKYIGEDNAKVVHRRVESSKEDSTHCLFRKWGKISVYNQ